MEDLLLRLFESWPIPALILVIAVTLVTLGKGADILVNEAVSLSVRWGVSKVVIGATIVSLGTTTPEAAVSVFAAVKGFPDLALGNAVGSIICDTALIIGVAALVSPLPLDKRITNRQGWLQVGFPALMVAIAFGSIAGAGSFPTEGLLPRWAGFLFVALLGGYMWVSIRWGRKGTFGPVAGAGPELGAAPGPLPASARSTLIALLKLTAGVGIIVVSSRILIPAVEVTAIRAGIPASVIAATLVAFGTSLPELVTAVTAARKGHGELAIGNIIGADILNVLFVIGVSAAVTPRGLTVPPFFFVFQFPAMMAMLLVFRTATLCEKTHIGRLWGGLLLLMYVVYLVVSYLM